MFDLLAIPLAEDIAVLIGIGGCRCPISMRVMRITAASCPFWKRAASLASAAEARPLRNRLHNV